MVGSGAAGVNFALTLLDKGYKVRMLDVGRRGPAPVMPEEDFEGLKERLEDPVGYLLGSKYEALILPDFGSEYYGFPPSKNHIFEESSEFRFRASGIEPLVSFAAGGLAEAWTGGSYPFNDAELSEFPFGYSELRPYYSEVAKRIGVMGLDDDLARFMPLHEGLLEPLKLDEHSAMLLSKYERNRASLNRNHRFYMGRARLAALTKDLGGRKACSYLGRCLWGCPTRSLYTPTVTLAECLEREDFEYVPGHYVSHFRFDSANRVTAVVAKSISSGAQQEFPLSHLVLAGGTLSSSTIFLQSIYRDSGEIRTLRGLMDNRQVMMPFLNLGMLGRRFEARSYQYHQVAIGVEGSNAREYIHGLVTTLKTAMIHPLIQTLPFDLATSTAVFRNIHSALGLVNINFADWRREENLMTLDDAASAEGPRLAVQYASSADEPARIRSAIRTFRGALWKLGCVAPPSMTRLRPMGASVHYAGTIPMSAEHKPLTCSAQCRSHDFDNLFFVDGTSLPDLPAKNLTLTLMANAVRVAHSAF